MKQYKNVFSEVYKYLLMSQFKTHRQLFEALDEERITGIILTRDGVYWTEEQTFSRGLTNTQAKILNTIMRRLYGARSLHNENNN